MIKWKRLIDANALLYEYCQANGCNEVIDEVCPNCFTAGLIANAPTVDAVEVVRCKDCAYATCNPVKLTYGCRHPSGLRGFVNEGFYFCSYGERRTNERKSD